MEIQKFLEIQAMIKEAEDNAARNNEGPQHGRSLDDIPGMMNEAQLEAFQLLKNLERERRSGGRRRKGAGEEEV